MRIYLDTSIFQDLKKEEHAKLLSLVSADKEKNAYLFSEAHLHDLNRDTTDIKFADMKFMEEIVGRQCFSYEEKLLFRNLTPTEYYESKDWTWDANPDIKETARSNFGIFPLNLSNTIQIDNIPEDYPQSFVELLSKTTDMSTFTEGMLDFTEELSDKKKRSFRDMLKYLHQNSLSQAEYENQGIKGFDGTEVFDMPLFRNTYLEFVRNKTIFKDDYNLFIMAYNFLEIYGIVKGKPKIQYMPNLRDDSRHAFFGACCDLIVSKDDDFLKKTKFIYQLFGFDTVVMTRPEFETYLLNFNPENDTLESLEKEIKKQDDDMMWEHWIDEDTNNKYYKRKLNELYYSMFDTLTFVMSSEGNYYFFSRGGHYCKEGTYGKEIEYITNKLVQRLGEDSNENSTFDTNELQDNEWVGREWYFDKVTILLTVQNGAMRLYFELVFPEE